jgi:hypothetical protein
MPNWTEQILGSLRRHEQAKERLLPPDMQGQLIEAADAERDRLLGRVAEIDAELVHVDGLLEEARAAEQAAYQVVTPAPARVENWDGTIREILARPYAVRGKEAVAAGKRVAGLLEYRRRLEEERVGRLSQLGDVGRVRKQAQQGVVSGLLAIVAHWAAAPAMWQFQEKEPRCDRFGNPLDASQVEALASAGKGVVNG